MPFSPRRLFPPILGLLLLSCEPASDHAILAPESTPEVSQDYVLGEIKDPHRPRPPARTVILGCDYPVLEVKLKTFIACNAIATYPGDPFAEDYYEGDDRTFSYASSRYRTQQAICVTVSPLIPSGVVTPATYSFGTTRGYDASDVTEVGSSCCNATINPGAVPECTGTASSGLTTTVTRLTPFEIRVDLGIDAHNPCVPPGYPDIDATISVYIRQYCDTTTGKVSPVTYRVTGTHDGFPWYELYLSQKGMGDDGSWIYYYDADAGGCSPSYLIGGTGDISIPPTTPLYKAMP